MKISLVPYDPAWKHAFAQARDRLCAMLGDRAVQVEHIGSTAVPGLSARPIVDILVGVRDLSDPDRDRALRDSGYEPASGVQRHLWIAGSPEIERRTAFRDRLRQEPAEAALYEHVKRRLAEREWREIGDYINAKAPVVNAILRRAGGQPSTPRIEAFYAVLARCLGANARVLEIGAGDGELAIMLEAAGHDVVALDPALRSRFPIVETSFEDYRAPEGSFDCIIAQLVLHHADDLDVILAKAERLLRPGGIVAVDDYGWERSPAPAFRSEHAELLTSEVMLRALRARFDESLYEDHAYFSEGAGTDQLGFTFIGRRRSSPMG